MIANLKSRSFAVGALAFALIFAAGMARAADGAAAATDWPVYGNDAADTHYSPLKSINRDNIKQLHAAYAVSTGTLRSNEATPIVIDGTMYLSSSWGPRFVYALDATTGKQIWKVTVVDYKQGASITSPPSVIGDKVITGFAGGEYGARGYLS